MKVLKLRDYLFVILIIAIPFVFGSIFDKDISKAVYADFNHPEIADFLGAYLVTPYYFIIYFAIFSFALSIKPYMNLVIRIILYAICAYLLVFTGYRIYKQFDELNKYFGIIGNSVHIAFIIFICLTSSLLVYIFIARKKIDKIILIKTASIVLIVFTVVTFAQLNIKEIWSRPRPFYVFSHINEYKEWWQLQPYACLKNKAYASFPSGHSISSTLLACFALVYSVLFKKLNNKKARLIIYYVLIIFAMIMGFSRMLSGQHFLTDTCFGIVFSLSIFYITTLIANKIIKKPLIN